MIKRLKQYSPTAVIRTRSNVPSGPALIVKQTVHKRARAVEAGPNKGCNNRVAIKIGNILFEIFINY